MVLRVASYGNRQQTAASQRTLQRGLDTLAHARIRVSDPRDVRFDVERRVNRTANAVGKNDTQLLSDHCGADVVWMTTQRVGQTARGVNRLREGPDVGDEPVPPCHQLVQLTARREVLILETRRLARHWRAEHFGDD